MLFHGRNKKQKSLKCCIYEEILNDEKKRFKRINRRDYP